MGSNIFWDRVVNCKHENLYDDYYEPVYCETPYCYGDEVHCKDCKVFISKCDCGYSNYLSGWPAKRYSRGGVNRNKKIIGRD